MYIVIPLLIFFVALLMFGMAWLSGHRTPIPMGVKPAVFWYPGVGLLMLTAVAALAPSALMWNRCSSACDPATNAENAAEVAKCITMSTRSIRADWLKRDQERTPEEADAYVAGNAEQIQEQCVAGLMRTCVEGCFESWRNPPAEDGAPASM